MKRIRDFIYLYIVSNPSSIPIKHTVSSKLTYVQEALLYVHALLSREPGVGYCLPLLSERRWQGGSWESRMSHGRKQRQTPSPSHWEVLVEQHSEVSPWKAEGPDVWQDWKWRSLAVLQVHSSRVSGTTRMPTLGLDCLGWGAEVLGKQWNIKGTRLLASCLPICHDINLPTSPVHLPVCNLSLSITHILPTCMLSTDPYIYQSTTYFIFLSENEPHTLRPGHIYLLIWKYALMLNNNNKIKADLRLLAQGSGCMFCMRPTLFDPQHHMATEHHCMLPRTLELQLCWHWASMAPLRGMTETAPRKCLRTPPPWSKQNNYKTMSWS